VVGSLFYSYITFASKQAAASAKDPVLSNAAPVTGVSVEVQQTRSSDGDRR